MCKKKEKKKKQLRRTKATALIGAEVNVKVWCNTLLSGVLNDLSR